MALVVLLKSVVRANRLYLVTLGAANPAWETQLTFRAWFSAILTN